VGLFRGLTRPHQKQQSTLSISANIDYVLSDAYSAAAVLPKGFVFTAGHSIEIGDWRGTISPPTRHFEIGEPLKNHRVFQTTLCTINAPRTIVGNRAAYCVRPASVCQGDRRLSSFSRLPPSSGRTAGDLVDFGPGFDQDLRAILGGGGGWASSRPLGPRNALNETRC